MKIYDKQNNKLFDVLITESAEYEQELMKSDFVKLQWNSVDNSVLPTDSYIIPFPDVIDPITEQPIRYSLLEPYSPVQKNEGEYQYEPQFHHPKMYLGKVPFTHSSRIIDEENSQVALTDAIEWSYAGSLSTLLEYFCECINKAFGLTDESDNKIGYEIVGEVPTSVFATFSTQDILSALSNIATVQECEWHIDWQLATLFFGHIKISHNELTKPILQVGTNIGMASVRDSKDGFYNAFLPQGSSRNVTKKASNGESVQSLVRVSLQPNKDYTFTSFDGTQRTIQIPDGTVYTDEVGHILTKSEFDVSQNRKHIKSVIFEDVYPRQDLYVYDVRCREKYVTQDVDGKEEKVVEEELPDGTKVYKKFAVWYVKLAQPVIENGHVTRWEQYKLTKYYSSKNFANIVPQYYQWDDGSQHAMFSIWLKDYTKESWQKMWDYIINNDAESPAGYRARVKAGNVVADAYIGCVGGSNVVLRVGTEYETISGAQSDPTGYAFFTAAQAAEQIIIEPSLTWLEDIWNYMPQELKHSQIISGKQAYIAFQPNTYMRQVGGSYKIAQSTPLAGRGNGDGEGHYGFELFAFETSGDVSSEMTIKSNDVATDVSQLPQIEIGDIEIIHEENGDYILPTLPIQGIIPKGALKDDGTTAIKTIDELNALSNKDDGYIGNKINLYNIIVSANYEDNAERELATEVSKYIKNQFIDNNSYTFKSNPVAFDNNNPNLYIGQEVIYRDLAGYQLETRVMKLVTKLDFAFEQEITVGNEILKGSQQQLKDKVETVLSGGSGGDGTGGMNRTQVLSLLSSWVTPRFLQKTIADTADKVITFTEGIVSKARNIFEKGFWVGSKHKHGIDEDGVATLDSITAEDAEEFLHILKSMDVQRALKVFGMLEALVGIKSPNVQSDNYTGDGAFDTGYLLSKYKSEGNNHSYLVIDEMFVRIKAIFNELEIRKVSFSGGDLVFSHAGSKVLLARTLYMKTGTGITINTGVFDSENHAVILPGAIYDAYEKSIVINQEDVDTTGWTEFAYRCYFQKDDGTMATRNWWKVDDQARCQTFGVLEPGTYHDVETTYYWRRVIGVGSEKITIGVGEEQHEQTYDYIDLSIEDCDAGSTIPHAGDQIVQMGNRTDTERQDFIMLDITSAVSPAFKMYNRVNGYSLEGKNEIQLSTKDTFITANKIVIKTDYGTFQQPKERGEWLDIPTDEQGRRKCYYYDLVQHNGATWLCIKPEPQYTTDEPSESSEFWRIYAQKGVKGDKGDSVAYDPDHSSLGYAYSSMGTPEQGRDYPSDITSWNTTPPTPQKGKYLWTKDTTAYNNAGTIVYTTTYGVTYEPNDGESVEIDTSRTFVKYCKQSSSEYTGQHPADNQFSTTYPSSLGQGDYLWILNQLAYVGVTDPMKSYSVSMLGTDGSQGDPGADGYTTHFAYATSADGSQNFSTSSFNGATYIGTYRDQLANDSTDYHSYTWTKWKGDKGDDGYTPQKGVDYFDGYNNSQVVLYQRYTPTQQNPTPALPTGALTYTFSTGLLTPADSPYFNGWTQTPPTADNSKKLFVTMASACSRASSVSIAANQWATPVEYVADGVNGINSVRIDLDNEADIISLDSNKKVRFDKTVVVNASIYDGAVRATSGVTHGMTPAQMIIGVCQPTITSANGIVTITWAFTKGMDMSSAVWEKNIQLTYNYNSYGKTFSLGTTDADAIWQIQPSPSTLSFSTDANNQLTPSSIVAKCGYVKTTGSGTESVEEATTTSGQIGTTGMYLYYRTKTNGSWGAWTAYPTAGVTINNNTTNTDIEFCITDGTIANDNSNIVDREVVPIVKDGLAGAPGINHAVIVIYKRAASRPDNSARPADGVIYTFADGSLSGTLNGWTTKIPDGSNPCWMRQATALGTGTTDTIGSTEWSGDTNGNAIKFVENGAPGDDALDIQLTPSNCIIPQSEEATEGVYPLIYGNAFTEVHVTLGDDELTAGTDYTVTTKPNSLDTNQHCNGKRDDNQLNKVWIDTVLTETIDGKSYFYERGYLTVIVTYNGNTYERKFGFACNLLGEWKEETIGDTKKEIAKSTWFDLDANGEIVESDRLGTFIRSSKENTSRLENDSYFKLDKWNNLQIQITADDRETYGNRYRLTFDMTTAVEDVTVTFAGTSLDVKSYNTFEYEYSLLAGTYTLSFAKKSDGSAISPVISNLALYAVVTTKYSQLKQTADGLTSDVKGIKAGKNLFKGVLTGSEWYSESTVPFASHPGMTNVTVDSNGFFNVATGHSWIVKYVTLQKGQYYTISAELKSAATIPFMVFYGSTIYGSGQLTQLSGKIVSGYFKYDGDGNGTYSGYVAFNVAALRYPQIELGKEATAFVSGDTEISSQIKQTADSINLSVQNNYASKSELQITAEGITSKVDGIDNSKNLFPNFGEGWQSYEGHTDTITITPSTYKVDDSNTDMYSPVVALMPNTQYCFSAHFDTEPSSGNGYALLSAEEGYTHNSDIWDDGDNYEITWHRVGSTDRYYFVFTTPNDGDTKNFVFNYYDTPCALYKPQLEEGNTPTDFYPYQKIAKSSEIAQKAGEISLFVTDGLKQTGINITTGKIQVVANQFEIWNSAKTLKTFSIGSDGSLTSANGASFNGKITASSGTIGGFNIAEHKLYSSNNNIILNDDGTAKITGQIEATSGHLSNMLVGESNNNHFFFSALNGEGYIIGEDANYDRKFWLHFNQRSTSMVFYQNSDFIDISYNSVFLFNELSSNVTQTMRCEADNLLFLHAQNTGATTSVKIGLDYENDKMILQSDCWPDVGAITQTPNLDIGKAYVMTLAQFRNLLNNYAYNMNWFNKVSFMVVQTTA